MDAVRAGAARNGRRAANDPSVVACVFPVLVRAMSLALGRAGPVSMPLRARRSDGGGRPRGEARQPSRCARVESRAAACAAHLGAACELARRCSRRRTRGMLRCRDRQTPGTQPEPERVRRAVRPVDQVGVPIEDHSSRGAPSPSRRLRVRRALPSGKESPRSRQPADREVARPAAGCGPSCAPQEARRGAELLRSRGCVGFGRVLAHFGIVSSH